MKILPLVLFCAVALLLPACASQPTVVASKADEPLVLERVTGSRTAKDVPVAGREAMSASPVHIITREDIERSGRSTLADVLRDQPYVH